MRARLSKDAAWRQLHEAATAWVDRMVTRVRGHRVPPSWGRPLVEWMALLRRLGFLVLSIPMNKGTPFANVLLVADMEESR